MKPETPTPSIVSKFSTSKGLMCDRDARKAHVGGEVVAYVW